MNRKSYRAPSLGLLAKVKSIWLMQISTTAHNEVSTGEQKSKGADVSDVIWEEYKRNEDLWEDADDE